MRKQNKLVFKLLAGLVATAALAVNAQTKSPIVHDSVKTVDELIKLDNAAAMAKAKEDAIKAGLIKPERNSKANEKPPEPPTIVRVVSITGIHADYSVRLNINGNNYENLRVGSTARGCVVDSIQDKCVVLKPQPVEVILQSSKPSSDKKGNSRTKGSRLNTATAVKPQSCPSACWTGVTPPPALPSGVTVTNGAGSPPMPLPLQTPPRI